MAQDDKLTQVIGTLSRLTSDIFTDAIQRKLILDNLSEGVFTVDSACIITSFNKAAEAITGIREDEALGKVCNELFSDDADDGFCIVPRAIDRRKPLLKVMRQLAVKKRFIPVLVSASPMIDMTGVAVGGIQSFQEVTEIFHRQLILDSVFDGVFTIDLDRQITLFNKAAEKMTGFSQQDVIGKSFDHVFNLKKNITADNSALLRAIETGKPCTEESAFIEINDGSTLPVSVSAAPLLDARGKIFGGVETFRDNTDQLQTDLILDSVADGVFTVNQDFIVTSFNKAAEQITGHSAKEVLGKQCRDILGSELCATACPIAKALETKEKVVVDNASFLAKDGSVIPVSVTSTALLDGDGHIIGGVETFRDLTEITSLRDQLSKESIDTGILTRSSKMQRIMSVLPQFAKSESTILVLGESGTGKELIAKAIHELSPRDDKPFIAVNSGALPDTLLESELFGYKAGAFTDARRDKKGRFAAAEKGTLFLDEIGDISPAMQVKLLRVLQSKMYEPLGSNEPVYTDVRIIAATNKNLVEMVKHEKFREDLYYRLNVVKVDLPPLRDRMEDIPLLVEHFVEQFNRQRKKSVKGISQEALAVLMRHDYPGNIRELENIIEYAFILCHDTAILPQHLPESFQSEDDSLDGHGPLTLLDIEKRAIVEALNRNDFKKMKTCRELGISKDTLRRKLRSYGMLD